MTHPKHTFKEPPTPKQVMAYLKRAGFSRFVLYGERDNQITVLSHNGTEFQNSVDVVGLTVVGAVSFAKAWLKENACE